MVAPARRSAANRASRRDAANRAAEPASATNGTISSMQAKAASITYVLAYCAQSCWSLSRPAHTAHVPGAQVDLSIRHFSVWSADARQMNPCTPPSTVRKMAVAAANATMANADVWPEPPRRPGRWNSRHSANVLIGRLLRELPGAARLRVVQRSRAAPSQPADAEPRQRGQGRRRPSG